MDAQRLVSALSTMLPPKLARDLVEDFLKVRQDFSTKTLERSSPGKLVETCVQCLQHLATGTYAAKPDVDGYLNKKIENEKTLPDDLRICAARVARSIYTMRNRRNIAHKGTVDPNIFDLAYLHYAAAWLVTEFLRQASGLSMQEAGVLISQVQAPVSEIVEEIDGVRLVHANVSIKDEIRILLHSHFPNYVPNENIKASLVGRNQGTLGNKLRELVGEKQIFGAPSTGYRLTLAGWNTTETTIRRVDRAA